MKKIQLQAKKAKKLGYTHISSVIKSHMATTYYHVLDIDYVIEHGWARAPRLSHRFKNGYWGVISYGVGSRPAGCISRADIWGL
jgi:hypothetical protein